MEYETREWMLLIFIVVFVLAIVLVQKLGGKKKKGSGPVLPPKDGKQPPLKPGAI